ncbi:recombinase family protein [Flavobacteriaceae bacterium D16]|nr:recombinase family protein [Flavobacteriaceae bacterium D16]
MKVLGYIRVSTKMQSDKGSSLRLQKSKIKSYCNLNEMELVEIYEDKGKSGMTLDKRDGYRDMINYIKSNKIDCVVVWSLSRLGRKLKDVVAFMEFLKCNNIQFYCIKEGLTNDDNIGGLIMNILGSINEFEAEIIRERIRDVKRHKKAKGEVYGRLKYGWNNENGYLVKNKTELKVIKRVKNLRSRGYSWRKISNRLNKDGIPSKEGKLWYDGSLYNMMRPYIS